MTIGVATASVEAASPGALDRGRDQMAAWLGQGVGAPDGGEPVEPFAADDPRELRLAAAGDVGTGDREEHETAAIMAQVARDRPFDVLVLLGDNVYPNGDPERLPATVFEPFADILDSGADLVPVLGNHDVLDGDAQVDALGMPGRWYAEHLGAVLNQLPLELDRVMASIRAGVDPEVASSTVKSIQRELAAARGVVGEWERRHPATARLTAEVVLAALEHADNLSGLLSVAEREPRARVYWALGLDLLLDPVGDPPTIRASLQLCGGGGPPHSIAATLTLGG